MNDNLLCIDKKTNRFLRTKMFFKHIFRLGQSMPFNAVLIHAFNK